MLSRLWDTLSDCYKSLCLQDMAVHSRQYDKLSIAAIDGPVLHLSIYLYLLSSYKLMIIVDIGITHHMPDINHVSPPPPSK